MGQKTIKLPSGKTAEVRPYKGKDIRQAMKVSEGDQSKLIFAIIAHTTTIDSKPVVMEDLDEMDGSDVFALMSEFGNFTQSGQEK
ncbi:MAG: hypothetical protein ACK505_12335 [Flavobacteriales bacterium]|jgi:hypothetical protein